MKIIKVTITTLFIILFYSFCYAQIELTPSQWLSEHKKEIRTTSYIFEGTITRQSYYNGTKQAIAICIMQITKIFKGAPQLKLGSIKVVTWQGPPVINGMSSGTTSDDGYMVPFGKGGTYIIFGRPVSSSVDSTLTDNTLVLTIWGMDYSIIISANDSVSWYDTPQFKTKQDIYSFFTENGLTVQEELTQPADSVRQK